MSNFTIGKAMDNMDKSLDDIISERKSILKRNLFAKKQKKTVERMQQAKLQKSKTQRQTKINARRGMTKASKNDMKQKNSQAHVKQPLLQPPHFKKPTKNHPNRKQNQAGQRPQVRNRVRQRRNKKAKDRSSFDSVFHLPKGANMRITVNLKKVQPIQGLDPRISGYRTPSIKSQKVRLL